MKYCRQLILQLNSIFRFPCPSVSFWQFNLMGHFCVAPLAPHAGHPSTVNWWRGRQSFPFLRGGSSNADPVVLSNPLRVVDQTLRMGADRNGNPNAPRSIHDARSAPSYLLLVVLSCSSLCPSNFTNWAWKSGIPPTLCRPQTPVGKLALPRGIRRWEGRCTSFKPARAFSATGVGPAAPGLASVQRTQLLIERNRRCRWR